MADLTSTVVTGSSLICGSSTASSRQGVVLLSTTNISIISIELSIYYHNLHQPHILSAMKSLSATTLQSKDNIK